MGLTYKIGFAVMVTGVIIMVSSGALGEAFFAAITGLLTLLGAPEDRDFLSPSYTEAGEQMLQMAGGLVIACGACVVCIRLLLGLLGLAGKPVWTGKLGRWATLGLGAAALGLLISIFGAIPELLLYDIFRYDYGQPGTMATLEAVIAVGNVLLGCGLVVMVLGKPLRALIHNRINWLGLGLVMIGFTGAVAGLGALFIIVGVIGAVPLTVGVWRLLAANGANP